MKELFEYVNKVDNKVEKVKEATKLNSLSIMEINKSVLLITIGTIINSVTIALIAFFK